MSKLPKSFLLRKGQTIVFDGDSATSRRTQPSLDTWPLLDLLNWRITWADEFARLLFCLRPDLNLKFHNAAVGGSIMRGMLERFDKFVAPHKPDWLLITDGGNDSARKIPMRQYASDCEQYVARAGKLGARVVFLTFQPCVGMPAEKKNKYNLRMKYYKALAGIVRSHGGMHVDVGPTLQKKAGQLYAQSTFHTIYSDGGHYNAIGSLIIAGAVLKALGFQLI
ncbi:MAG: hypothetical protein HZA50_02045 [Planctomycetes bacterium]|nr:hypothetical protein [Planctomycetota bacterium]